MQTSLVQRIRDIDILASLLEGRTARIQSAEIDPVDGLVVFNVEVLDSARAEQIAASFARRELMVNAKVFSAITRDIHRRIRNARGVQR